MTGAEGDAPVPVLSIPEIRDYERINAELAQCLDAGCPRVVLAGAEGQRFLTAGLAGRWNAVVEIQGNAGPDLAANLDARGLTVVCRGNAADGAGHSLRAGRLIILGDAGDALGYGQRGGTVLVAQAAGTRAGLNQQGGVSVVLGTVGRLAGERQAGGWLFAFAERLGPYAGRGQRGGRLVALNRSGDIVSDDPAAADLFRETLRQLQPWLDAGTVATVPGL